MNGQPTHLPVICSILNIPMETIIKKIAAISQRFFMTFCALSSAKGMDIKMKELVEVIAKALVDDPESVTVNERTEKKTTILEVRVADSDMGKVIGKQGRIAKAIRSVVKAAAAKEDKKVIVDILD